ncbi:MAG: transcriptional regulator [Halobacteriales archaeon]
MRDRLVADVVSLLEDGEFEVSDTCNIRPKSFDLVARRGSLVLFVKVLVNVDGLDRRSADELKLLSHHLDASALVVGRKTRDGELEDGVLYLRRGIPALNPATAYDQFVEGVPPFAYMSRGGLYVNVDGDVLEDRRRENGMSLGQVAQELGVSRRSVSKYEDGMDASIDVALRLEEVFDADVVLPVDVFPGPVEYDEPEPELDEDERTAYTVFRRTGFEVHHTTGAPFRAVVDRDRDIPDALLTGSGGTSTARKRARLMSSIGRVTETESIYLMESHSDDTLEDTVVIEYDELREFDSAEELYEVYRERRG